MKILIILAGLFVLVYAVYYKREIQPEINTRHNLSLLGGEAPLLREDEIAFRDLNKNGKLDPYEDPRRSLEERVENLLSQMTLEEKAGMMFHTMIGMNEDGTLQERGSLIPMPQSSDLIASRLMNHFNVLQTAEPRQMAEWYNRIQKLAERTRLGLPSKLIHTRLKRLLNAPSHREMLHPPGFGWDKFTPHHLERVDEHPIGADHAIETVFLTQQASDDIFVKTKASFFK